MIVLLTFYEKVQKKLQNNIFFLSKNTMTMKKIFKD
jgi:hypothetical protein